MRVEPLATVSEKAGTLRISEIFGPTIQGEGMLMGQPTVFVRAGGCDYRCSWCDTLYAVDSTFRSDWQSLSTEAVWEEVEALSGGQPLMVSLSGGNPAIQPFEALIDKGKAAGYRFMMETQGSIAKDWFAKLDHLTLSPKGPSSGEDTNWDKLSACVEAAGQACRVGFKVVVMDEADYDYAKQVQRLFPEFPLTLQAGNHTPPAADGSGTVDRDGIMARMRWLVDRVAEDRWFNVTVLPQLHVMVWGNERGV